MFVTSWKDNESYFEALKVLASFSGLFSESAVPYLDYRLAENIFCKFYKAENEARSCTAYDAKLNSLGIGIKTFILKNGQSMEKVAEFNRLKPQLDNLSGIDLARRLGYYRNTRIQVADDMYGTSNRLYHIVGRTEGALRIFNTSYDRIAVENIRVLHSTEKSLSFEDGYNEYTFNRSKSVLIKRFILPVHEVVDIPVDIISDPLSLLVEVANSRMNPDSLSIFAPSIVSRFVSPKEEYVILPLYSSRGVEPFVPLKSGLNQWNAAGRVRDPNEIYIPIPIEIHRRFPDFFPERDEHFILKLPNGSSLSAKVCQDNSKALMSTHNADLGKWILRDILHKPEGELVTMADLDCFGIDSVRIVKEKYLDYEGRLVYSISFTATGYESYSEFIGED